MFSVSQSDKNHETVGKERHFILKRIIKKKKLGCTSLYVSPVYLCQASMFPKDANIEVLMNYLSVNSFFAHLKLEFLQCFVNKGQLFLMV